MSEIRIWHFSDPHAGGGAEDMMAFLDKRWVGAFNYRFRRRFQHDMGGLRSFVTAALTERPDVLICTGDLTSTGQAGEFAQTLRLLKPLVRAKIPMIFVPGNHDYYVTRRRCTDAMRSVFRRLNGAVGFTFDDLPQKRTLFGLDFLAVNECWPSNLISSCGYLKKDSQDFIVSECDRPKERPRILVGHYPLIEDHPWLRIRHRLWGQGRILPLLRTGRLDLSLCGHVHHPYARLNLRGQGEICAGSVTRNHCFAEIRYTQETGCFLTRHLRFSPDGTLTPWLSREDYHDYSS